MPVIYRLKMISLILIVIPVLYGLQMISFILIHLFSVSGFFLYFVIVCVRMCVCQFVYVCVCLYVTVNSC